MTLDILNPSTPFPSIVITSITNAIIAFTCDPNGIMPGHCHLHCKR